MGAMDEEALSVVEGHLRAAVATAERLATAEDGLLGGNPECKKELQRSLAARESLCLLLCQGGRDEEAAPHLAALDFKFRLAREARGAAAGQSLFCLLARSSSSFDRWMAACELLCPTA